MLQTKELVKKFGKKEVLHGISVDLTPGVYGLLGPNGSGKTTFVRCLLGAYKCTSGSVLYNDKLLSTKNTLEGKVGYLPQKFGMYRELRVYDALEYVAAMKKLPVDTEDSEIRRCLDMVNLEDRIDSKIGSLSGGMLRRLGIASAFLGDPAILVFDEPTAGLDPEERMRFKNCIRAISKDKIVIISTHILEDVEVICDQILVMTNGQIVRACPLQELSAAADGKVFTVREADLQPSCEVVSMFDSSDGKVLRILTNDPTPAMTAVSSTVEDGYLCVVKGI